MTDSNGKKVLMVITSHAELGNTGEKTGFWVEEFAAVCHATAAFINIKDVAGEYVVKGKVVTGFTNAEEDAVQLTDVVPFLLEDELVKRGADFQKVADWNAFAVQDGLLISDQNPAVLNLLQKNISRI